MKTQDLINALARDATVAPPPALTLARDLACGALLTLLLFFALTGVRPDIGQALASPRFLLKPVLTISLFVAALGLLLRLARPGAPAGLWRLGLLVAPLLLLVGVSVELYVLPGDQWRARAVGHNALWCLAMIPMLAAAPLVCGLHALRQAAPTRPALTGAVAGLVAGALGATFYAFHCTDDSPLFVAVWYLLALLIVTLAGALSGSRLLRW
jgi:hypothetical protein